MLLSGRVGPAARYTQDMCKAIVRGILAQKELDRNQMAQVGQIEGVRALGKNNEDEIHKQARRTHEETERD